MQKIQDEQNIDKFNKDEINNSALLSHTGPEPKGKVSLTDTFFILIIEL